MMNTVSGGNPFRPHFAELAKTAEERRQYSAAILESAWNVIEEIENELRDEDDEEEEEMDDDDCEIAFDLRDLLRGQ